MPRTDEILGVHIVGPMASELISEAVGGDGIPRICGRHRPYLPRAPSLSEATKEAALAVDKRSLNF